MEIISELTIGIIRISIITILLIGYNNTGMPIPSRCRCQNYYLNFKIISNFNLISKAICQVKTLF